MKNKPCLLTQKQISHYIKHLQEQECAAKTIQKYTRDLIALLKYLDGRQLTKGILIEWKGSLMEKYAPASVNSMLTAVNCFLSFTGRREMAVRLLKIQRSLICDESRELSREEYTRLVRAAESKGNQKLSLLIQTICSTGIRVSELQYITVEAVRTGRAQISNKGKQRIVFIPHTLRKLLKKYLQKQKIIAGAVFVTRTGRPLDRSNIWRSMKALCEQADIAPEKVFPHNLRHFFARVHYSMEKDLLRLADILGHSNINTTRIYTAESGFVYARRLEHMKLVIT